MYVPSYPIHYPGLTLTLNSAVHEVVSVLFLSNHCPNYGANLSIPRTEGDEHKAKNVWLKGHTGEYSAYSDYSVEDSIT